MASTLRPNRRPPHLTVSSTAINTACGVAAILLVLAALAWPRTTSTPAPNIADTPAVPAVAPAQPTAIAQHTLPGREIRLDLPPIGETSAVAAGETVDDHPVAVAGAEATPVTESHPRTELIADGGFERDSDAWYLEPPAAVATGPAVRGDRYLSLRPGDGYAGQRFTVEPGAKYRVTVWVWSSNPGAASGQAGVRFEDDRYRAVEILDPETLTAAPTGWTRVTFTITAPATATQAILSFRNPSETAAIRIDSVSVRMLAVE